MLQRLFRISAALLVAYSTHAVSPPAQVVFSELMYHPGPGIPEDPAEEWVEMQNLATEPLNLSGYRLSGGVEFTFTNVVLAPGEFVVVAAHLPTFRALYPGVTNVVGDWTGKLANDGEKLRLVHPFDIAVSEINYANEGDWAERRAGEAFPGHPEWWRGWQWTTAASGQGSSLELTHPALPQYGQSWSASLATGGTPGTTNSVAKPSIAPLVLEVRHFPLIPCATNQVTISAKVLSPGYPVTSVTAWRRVDGQTAEFTPTAMVDDGHHGDGLPQDGIYGCQFPAESEGTVVEFYVEARNASGSRTWPAPTDELGSQGANALYQVDEISYSGSQPIYRIITTESDWNDWLNLMDNVSGGRYSNARMNGTVILADGTGVAARYCAGIRNRGAGTRAAKPHNFRISIPRDNLLGKISQLNFNTRTVHSQVAGNALLNAAGLLNTYGAPVQVRVNSQNLANAMPDGTSNGYQFGSYFCFEGYDDDWLKARIPHDPDGNLYSGTWQLDQVKLTYPANLEYRGTNKESYRLTYGPNGATASSGAYDKLSNKAADDWSDLAQLTFVLGTNTPETNYLEGLLQSVDVDQWLSYFAANALLLNMETCLGTGTADDYSLYRGELDTRFRLLFHDLDTVLGQGDATPVWTRSVFKAADLPVISRFLKHPEIAPRYFAKLKDLAETSFSDAQVRSVLDRHLGQWVPEAYVDSMKEAAFRQRTNVLAQIPQALTVVHALPLQNTFATSTNAVVTLSGSANAIHTRSVLVNGSPAQYTPWQGAWSHSAVSLLPGVNRVLVQSLDGDGRELESTWVDIVFPVVPFVVQGGTLATNSTWSAAAGSYLIASTLTVSNGVTLVIEPGTTVYLASGAGITVANGGRLLAEGTAVAPIRFTVEPGATHSWSGIVINGGIGSPETRIAHAHLERNNSTAIHSVGGTVYLAHLTFGNTTKMYVSLDNSSFLVHDCHFPSGTTAFEPMHGTGGIKAGGRGIVRNCYFGTTVGYSDVLDFTGGNRDRNQPILQFINNVCAGSSDDILDLDGTDAWIEGNIFLHVHKNGSPDSSSAISGGNSGTNTSELTILRNLFFDCDQALTAKQGNSQVFVNNTIVKITRAGGQDTQAGAFNFRDTEPEITTFGRGGHFEANIIKDVEAVLRNYDPTQTTLVFSNNLMPMSWTSGTGNSTSDPLLTYIPTIAETQFKTWRDAQVLWEWFKPLPGSPAIGSSPNGTDLGACIPAGARITGEPEPVTARTDATLRVDFLRSGTGIPTSGFPQGGGYTHYRWRLDGGDWSPEEPTTNPIVLTGLGNGPHQVQVVGKRDSGTWQDDVEAGTAGVTFSRTWVVDTGLTGVRINEVLACNSATLETGGETPDLVELYNYGSTDVVLEGKGLTDDPTLPYKFKFPPGTVIRAGEHLVLYADASLPAEGNLRFGLSQTGDSLYLFEAAAKGGALLDEVRFGLQVADYSIGRLPGGEWGLCHPSFGSGNQAQPAGNPTALKINEWLAAPSSFTPEGFIELYNPLPTPVSLGGLYLSDAPEGTPDRYQIPPLSFGAGLGYILFQADDKTSAGADHLPFSLSANPGSIGVFSSDLHPIDRVEYSYQTAGISQGRTPNGGDHIAFFSTPTPGAGNPDNGGDVVQVPVNIPLLAFTNIWKYHNLGQALSSNWMEPGYNDSQWLAGPGLLGRETSSPFPYASALLTPFTLVNNSVAITAAYFRTAFVVPTNLAGLTIQSSVYVDDGAVFYLNGKRVASLRLSANPVYYTNLAQLQPTEGARETITIPASDLLVGTNVLAVEVHQNSPNSTDLVFGMEMRATGVLLVTNVTHIVLNEVLADNRNTLLANGTTADYVELYNPSTNAADLAGFSLTDNLAAPRRWVFPAGAVIPAGGFLVVHCNPDLPATYDPQNVLNTGFGLKASGDRVYLFNASAALFDSVLFGPQAGGFSIARLPNGADPWNIALPTPRASNIAAATGNQRHLRINEWAANVPSGPDWFEIYNPDAQPVSLGGLYVTDKLLNRTKHQIAPLTFVGSGTNAYLRLIADGDTAQGPSHVAFSMDGTLGEAVALYPPGTEPAIDSVTFGIQQSGVSQGRLPDGAPGITAFPNPTPADANWLPLTNVVISEVLSHTDLPLEDAVELENLSEQAVDIGGWWLSDSRRDLRKFRIPEGTTIPPKGYIVFYEYQFNPDPAIPGGFSFNSARGDEVWLGQANGQGELTGFRATAKFGPQFNGVSVGRVQTSIGPQFTSLEHLTLGSSVTAWSPQKAVADFRSGTGAANSQPRVGPVVIEEIMYQPPLLGTNDNVRDEYLVIRNISCTPVELACLETNGWRMDGAVRFQFQSGQVLPVGAAWVLVSFDPKTNAASLQAFRDKYKVTVPVLGPWSGQLGNTGETVKLLAPDNPQTVGPEAGLVPYVSIDEVKYASYAPWPTTARASGLSIQRTPATAYGNDPVYWVAASPKAGSVALMDADQDGMLDSWETAHGLQVNVNDAHLDLDGDGLTNLQEYTAGTNPADPQSALRLQLVSAEGQLQLEFVARAGRSYSLLSGQSPDQKNWSIIGSIPAEPFDRLVQITNGVAGGAPRYYRVVTPAQ